MSARRTACCVADMRTRTCACFVSCGSFCQGLVTAGWCSFFPPSSRWSVRTQVALFDRPCRRASTAALYRFRQGEGDSGSAGSAERKPFGVGEHNRSRRCHKFTPLDFLDASVGRRRRVSQWAALWPRTGPRTIDTRLDLELLSQNRYQLQIYVIAYLQRLRCCKTGSFPGRWR